MDLESGKVHALNAELEQEKTNLNAIKLELDQEKVALDAMKTDIEQQKAALDNEFAYHNGTNSELEKLTFEFGAEKESHAEYNQEGVPEVTGQSKIRLL